MWIRYSGCSIHTNISHFFSSISYIEAKGAESKGEDGAAEAKGSVEAEDDAKGSKETEGDAKGTNGTAEDTGGGVEGDKKEAEEQQKNEDPEGCCCIII